MDSLLSHPAVQGGLAPFVVGLAVVAILGRAKLGGLAVSAGFCLAVALLSGLAFSPLSATRKIVLLALVAPAIGVLVDLAVKSGRTLAVLIALACGALTVWVFWSVLQQKTPAQALLLGGGTAAFVAWVVWTTLALAGQPVRAGAAALMLGLGAAAGGFLLWQMVTGRKIAAGFTLTLSAALAAGLLAAAALVLAELPWYALIALAVIPLAVRLPAPDRLPVWLQAFIVSAYGFVPALAAYALTLRASAVPG